MKNTVIAACTAGLLILACSSPSEKKETTSTETKKSDSASVSAADILATANEVCMIKVELGKSSNQSNLQELRTFGERIATEDQKILDDVRTFAKSEGLSLSETLSEAKKKEIQDLTALQGTEYDKAFVRTFSKEQRRLFSQVRNYTDTVNRDISTFVRKLYPVLRNQNQDLRKIRKSLNPTEAKKATEKAA